MSKTKENELLKAEEEQERLKIQIIQVPISIK
jgi:hypothetical protein